ncbi:LysM peptidoglycan-binding domain-containing protein [Brevibacillus fluminis]|uniref:LysM peptidoglycan-binding domain-containing protein n=1 Tax=Brevibacillus fluminis TaxID=511487 RepID=A0A3M8D371_9BACL|nr:3D domain-containing protein [Brevibacillus fluminis]RNB82363.1 LysM peptidoglycan-binding domain-containing protein [Brevibacillus fluminis]
MKKLLSLRSLVSVTMSLFLMGMSAQAFAATYQIKENDTFDSISKQHDIPLQLVLEANKGVDPLNLQVGQAVQLPIQPAVKAAATPAPAMEKVVKAANGKEHAFTRQLSVVATAYTASPSENGQWAGLDYLGNKLKVGTIAVDPSVIPLGSTVYVKGYKYGSLPGTGMICRATDIGGAIKGNRVDIFVPGSDASNFGMQNVQLFVLK